MSTPFDQHFLSQCFKDFFFKLFLDFTYGFLDVGLFFFPFQIM
jgi:hypothetical protein